MAPRSGATLRTSGQRIAYLEGLVEVAAVCGPFYWRSHQDSEQNPKMAETLAAAIGQQDPDNPMRCLITVDGDMSDLGRARLYRGSSAGYQTEGNPWWT